MFPTITDTLRIVVMKTLQRCILADRTAELIRCDLMVNNKYLRAQVWLLCNLSLHVIHNDPYLSPVQRIVKNLINLI